MKIGSGINVVDGEISVSELTAVNVKTAQIPSVQETLDTLKSDTDNKLLSVRDAIVSKGGAVTGNPPTASQLVAGVQGIPTGGITRPSGLAMNRVGHVYGMDKKEGLYISTNTGAVEYVNKEMTKLAGVTITSILGYNLHGYVQGNGANGCTVFAPNGTVLARLSVPGIGYFYGALLKVNDTLYYAFRNGSTTLNIVNMGGTPFTNLGLNGIQFILSNANGNIVAFNNVYDTVMKVWGIGENFYYTFITGADGLVGRLLDFEKW